MADLALDADRDLALTNARLSLVYDADYRIQRLDIALRHGKGEWFRDEEAGTDYLGSILGKSTELSRRAELTRRILQVPGIREIAQMDLALDTTTRVMSGDISCVQDDGEPLDIRFTGR